MPLNPATPAKAIELAATRAVQHLLIPTEQAAAEIAGAAKEHELAAPQKVYHLGLADLKKRPSLAKARPEGWRYLVVQDDDPVAAAEVVSLDGTTRNVSASVNSGPFVSATARALEVAEKLDAVRLTQFDVRLLKIPALYVFALWLHAPSQDLLIPLDAGALSGKPSATGLKALTAYSPKDFFTALAPLAEPRLAFDDTPQLAEMEESRPSTAGRATRRKKPPGRK